jgi:tetratricopeptide (TPR) repeat protein
MRNRLGLFLATLALSACRSVAPAPAAPRLLQEIPLDLAAAEARRRAEPGAREAWVWYGRQLGYAGRFEEALALYGDGLQRWPGDAELLRHRGHRFLSVRDFEAARAELVRAAVAIEGQPDELELDGAPNEHGVPTSSLHTNIWYHLGLAGFFLGCDEEAARVFATCLALAPNDDMRVASAYWRCVVLFRLERVEEARALARVFVRELLLFESHDYGWLLRVFAGEEEIPSELLGEPGSVSWLTRSFGLAVEELARGENEAARRRLETLVASGDSRAFGRLAAELELARQTR